jgi:K+-transporting ATPase ATPase C chain
METNPKPKRFGPQVRPVVGVAILSLLVCGLLFPLFVTAVGQVLFPSQANGSLVKLDGRTVGSELIAQGFAQPVFFQPRNGSASGVDPDITLQDAMSQVQRISSTTGIPVLSLQQLVDRNVDPAGTLVELQYVNVLSLNVQLVQDYPSAYSAYA